MSLFKTPIRPPAILSDDAIERYIAAVRSEIDPDPLFRRRLRGTILNRYVAQREGRIAGPAAVVMGRIGRAVLYATFGLGVTVTGVMAASETAVPGDLLYPLKRQIEALRVTALPEQYHGNLAAYELAERISELDVLAHRQEWTLVAAMAPAIARDYAALAALDGGDVALDRHGIVLTGLLDHLPEKARLAVTDALEGTSTGSEPRDGGSLNAGGGDANAGGGDPSAGDGGNPNAGGGDSNAGGSPGSGGSGSGNGSRDSGTDSGNAPNAGGPPTDPGGGQQGAGPAHDKGKAERPKP